MGEIFIKKHDTNKLAFVNLEDINPGDTVYLNHSGSIAAGEIDYENSMIRAVSGFGYDFSDIHLLGPFFARDKDQLIHDEFDLSEVSQDANRQVILSSSEDDLDLIVVSAFGANNITITPIHFPLDSSDSKEIPQELSEKVRFLWEHLDFLMENLERDEGF